MTGMFWKCARVPIGILAMYGLVLAYRAVVGLFLPGQGDLFLDWGGAMILMFMAGFFAFGFLVRYFVPLWNTGSLVLSWLFFLWVMMRDYRNGALPIALPQDAVFDMLVLFVIVALTLAVFAGDWSGAMVLQRKHS
jgi:hypothetical protein